MASPLRPEMRSPSVPSSQLFSFDRFEVDLRSGNCGRAGIEFVCRRSLLTASVLLEHPGEVVTREGCAGNSGRATPLLISITDWLRR
jgi:hypothetical protein